MTLTTHAVAGALIGVVAYNNLPFAVAAALISHPLLDSIPHWDYHLSSTHKDPTNKLNDSIETHGEKFTEDLIKIAFDFCLGLAIVSLVLINTYPPLFMTALLCALIAVLPDPLQFVYWKTRSKLIEPLQRFHIYLHAATRLDDRPFLGVLSQVGMVALMVFCIYKLVA
jgi:hypothetical protein